MPGLEHHSQGAEEPLSGDLCAEIRERIARNQRVAAAESTTAKVARLWGVVRRFGDSAGAFLGHSVVIALAAAVTILLVFGVLIVAMNASGGRITVAAVAPLPEPSVREPVHPTAVLRHTPATSAADTSEAMTSAAEPASSTDGGLEDPAPVDADGFMVVVGTFRNPDNAKRLAESLEAGQTVSIRTEDAGRGLHRVTLGPFDLWGDAQAASDTIRNTIGLVPQVLRLKL